MRASTMQILGPSVILAALLAACSSGHASGTGGEGGAGGAATSTSSAASTSSSAGSSTSSSGCSPYQSTANLTTPAQSLSKDVMPIFAANCSFSACHGSGATGSLTIGATAADAKSTRAALVGVASMELPSMPYVTPGKPEESFLMHKMDGDQCVYDSSCASSYCGLTMPNGVAQLPPATRDIVRRWIAQGAADN